MSSSANAKFLEWYLNGSTKCSINQILTEMFSTYPVRDMIYFMWKGNLYMSKLNLETEGRWYKHFNYINFYYYSIDFIKLWVYDRIVLISTIFI